MSRRTQGEIVYAAFSDLKYNTTNVSVIKRFAAFVASGAWVAFISQAASTTRASKQQVLFRLARWFLLLLQHQSREPHSTRTEESRDTKTRSTVSEDDRSNQDCSNQARNQRSLAHCITTKGKTHPRKAERYWTTATCSKAMSVTIILNSSTSMSSGQL